MHSPSDVPHPIGAALSAFWNATSKEDPGMRIVFVNSDEEIQVALASLPFSSGVTGWCTGSVARHASTTAVSYGARSL